MAWMLSRASKSSAPPTPKVSSDSSGCLRVSSFVETQHANHAFNGIIFDIRNRGPVPVRLRGLSISGCLGRIRVYGTARYGEGSQGLQSSAQAWMELFDGVLSKSWDSLKALEIRPDAEMVLQPGEQRGLYIHSAHRSTWGQRNSGGIRYQSVWSTTEAVGRGEHLEILPGKGHTSTVPFDSSYRAAFRSPRAFVGDIEYTIALPEWKPDLTIHLQWPVDFRFGVMVILLAHQRLCRIAPRKLGKLPKDLIWVVVSYLPHDAFQASTEASLLSFTSRIFSTARLAVPLRDLYDFLQEDYRALSHRT